MQDILLFILFLISIRLVEDLMSYGKIKLKFDDFENAFPAHQVVKIGKRKKIFKNISFARLVHVWYHWLSSTKAS